MRKQLLAQIRAHQKSGTAELFEDIDVELKERLDVVIAEMESRTKSSSRPSRASSSSSPMLSAKNGENGSPAIPDGYSC